MHKLAPAAFLCRRRRRTHQLQPPRSIAITATLPGPRPPTRRVIVAAAVLSFSALFMRDTPTSLLMRGKNDAAKASLQKYRGIDGVDAELRVGARASVA